MAGEPEWPTGEPIKQYSLVCPEILLSIVRFRLYLSSTSGQICSSTARAAS